MRVDSDLAGDQSRPVAAVKPSARYARSAVLDRRTAAVGGSLLEPQLRRVGVDEDGPEYLHVLAGARLHVLVQDVDPSLCNHHTNTRSSGSIGHGEDTSSPRKKIRDDERNILFFCAE